MLDVVRAAALFYPRARSEYSNSAELYRKAKGSGLRPTSHCKGGAPAESLLLPTTAASEPMGSYAQMDVQ